MEDKELYEILQEYAEATRDEKDADLKKLHDKQQMQEEVKSTKTRNKIKPQYIFATALCCIVVIVLCIALPITLKNNQQDVRPTYCDSSDIFYDSEQNLSNIIKTYGINAYYPTLVTDADNMDISLISSKKDTSLHGVRIGYVFDEDSLIFFDIGIVPKTHILQTYESYISLPHKSNWNEYEIRFINEVNEETEMFEVQIYFTDGKYNYFVTVESDEEMEANDVLNLLYG